MAKTKIVNLKPETREIFRRLEASGVLKKHLYRSVNVKKYLAAIWNVDKEPKEEKIISQWLEHLDIDSGYEPRNMAEVEQLFDKYSQYLSDIEPKMDEFIKYGFHVAAKLFGRPKDWVAEGKFLDILETKEEYRKATKLSKSSGAPYFTQKGQVFDIVFDELMNEYLPNDKALPPAVAYARSYPNNKTRLVWGLSLHAVLLEATYARPLIQRFLSVYGNMTIGMWSRELGDRLSATMTKRYVYTLDYSTYDATIAKIFILKAFKILSTWFRPEDLKRMHWDKMVHNFIYCPLVLPDGCVYYGKNHGVPSGSYFTSMIDSIVNVAVIMAVSKKFGLHVDPKRVFVLGDDSIFCSYTYVDKIQIATWVQKQYGITINAEKAVISDLRICKVYQYLGKYWYLGVPHLPLYELATKMKFPETRIPLSRYDVEENDDALRMLSLVVLSYLSLCDEGMMLAMKAGISIFGGVDYDDLMSATSYMSGYLRYYISEQENDNTGTFKSNMNLGLFGLYAK